MTLFELRTKYGFKNGKNEPNPNCKHCHGNGERIIKSIGKSTFCICLFVDHDASNEIGDSLIKTANKLLKEIKNR